jgi:hypothetical protein
MGKFQDLTGKRFGRLVATKYLGNSRWECQCDCGKTTSVGIGDLKNSHTRSCGCLFLETIRTHGLTNSRLYTIREGMITRCYKKNSISYDNYGGRGITICDEWLNDFMSFYNWAMANGYDDNLTIERIDVNGNYEPSNCKWITNSEQSKNKRSTVYFTYNGETKIVSDWIKELGIPKTTFRRRIQQNRPIEEILYKGDLRCRKTK